MEKKTHVEVFEEDKKQLEKLRDQEGYRSIAVTLKKILEKYNDNFKLRK